MACKKANEKCSDRMNWPLQTYQYFPNVDISLMVYAIPTFQQDVSPISQSFLRRLNAMAPHEFLTQFSTSLTPQQKEWLMLDEKQRRRTFLVRWPHVGSLSGVEMAKAGFYALDDSDKVRCVFCKLIVFHWVAGDSPLSIHAWCSTTCRFVQGYATENRPCPVMMQLQDMPLITYFNNDVETITNENVLGKLLGINQEKARNTMYALPAVRLKTFDNWPTNYPVNAAQLCEAGFYYSGVDDLVYCFFCAGGLNVWENNDEPWQEHARWFPECPFLVNHKSNEYIVAVHQNTPPNKKVALLTREEKLLTVIQQSAFTRENIIFCCRALHYRDDSIDVALQIYPSPETNITEFINLLASSDSQNLPDHPSAQSSETTTNIMEADDSDDDDVKTGLPCSKCGSLSATRLCLPCGDSLLCDFCTRNIHEQVCATNFQPKCLKCGNALFAVLKCFFG